MLELRNVSKSFGKKQVLRDVSLSLRSGECFGLLGPNGAGKTTLLNLITGFQQPDSGTIALLKGTAPVSKEGQVPLTIVNGTCPQQGATVPFKRHIGLVPQEIALYENLSVMDNLRYFGELYGLSGHRLSGRIHELLNWIGLEERKTDRVKLLSGGMKRRLNLAAGLLHSPQLLLADEPTVGVDPQARAFIYELISQLKENGVTILYTTHYIPEVERLCDRVAILNEGRIAALGTLEEIIEKSPTGKENLETAFFELTGMALSK